LCFIVGIDGFCCSSSERVIGVGGYESFWESEGGESLGDLCCLGRSILTWLMNIISDNDLDFLTSHYSTYGYFPYFANHPSSKNNQPGSSP
jgi:hypothetical protein